MGIWSRVGAVVALLALPLALAVGSQALADRPGAPAMPDQPVELVEADPDRQPSEQPSQQPSQQPSSQPADDGGPRVVTPSPAVPLDDDEPDGDADDDADDGTAGDSDD